MKAKSGSRKKAGKRASPLTDRQMFDQALDAVGYWSGEAKRWQEFAAATQDVCVAQARRIEALEQQIARLNAPRVGCDECEYTGFLVSPVDDILPTGEVVQRLIFCPNCYPVLRKFIEGCARTLDTEVMNDE